MHPVLVRVAYRPIAKRTGWARPVLCEGTWRNLDFALAQMWAGSLETTEALAGGWARIDFRFKANAGVE